ncbi:MAG: thioredoxin [Bacteroidales bacterium]|nr:thioredoxin [Bacteroidales bacterium]
MTTGLYILAGVVVAFIALITYNYNKMKNIKDVATSKQIKILNNKNFKTIIRNGIVLVDFWAPWCAPCKIIAPTLNEIAEENDNVTIAKVNVEQNQQLAQKFKIRNIPTLILFKDGKELKRILGVKPKRVLLKEISI